jgi:hypothetical protein
MVDRARPHVFISYTRRDRRFAEKLQRRLKASQIATWRDLAALRGGDKWRTAVENALREAFALVVVLSPRGVQSEYVTHEYSFAMGAGKPVIPVMWRRARIPAPLADLQVINLAGKRKRWVHVISALRAPATGLVRARGAAIRAEFWMVGDRPKKNKHPKADRDEYFVELTVEGAPRGTRRADFRVHDPTFSEPKWTEWDPSDGFWTWLTSYGDVLVSCTLHTPAGPQHLEVTLYDALRRSHEHDRRHGVRRALDQIKRR